MYHEGFNGKKNCWIIDKGKRDGLKEALLYSTQMPSIGLGQVDTCQSSATRTSPLIDDGKKKNQKTTKRSLNKRLMQNSNRQKRQLFMSEEPIVERKWLWRRFTFFIVFTYCTYKIAAFALRCTFIELIILLQSYSGLSNILCTYNWSYLEQKFEIKKFEIRNLRYEIQKQIRQF